MKTINQQLGNNGSPPSNDGSGPDVAASPPSHAGADGSGRIKSTLTDNPRMMKIIPAFIDGLPGEVRKMTDLLEKNDLGALRLVVHQLLGASGGYGFPAVSEPAAKAEASIEAGKAVELISNEIKSLIEVIRRIDGYDESKVVVDAEEFAK